MWKYMYNLSLVSAPSLVERLRQNLPVRIIFEDEAH